MSERQMVEMATYVFEDGIIGYRCVKARYDMCEVGREYSADYIAGLVHGDSTVLIVKEAKS